LATVQGRVTEHNRLNDLVLARLINKSHGAGVISAMEVEQLDETWLDFFKAVVIELPHMQARQKHIDNLFREFENSHPTYGQRFKQ